MQLEDGEIADDDDEIDPYTPLERPLFPKAPTDVPMNSDQDEEEEEEQPDNSPNCSSDDESEAPKRRKLTPLPMKPQRKKYTVWCRDPNVQLSDFLNSFKMKTSKNDRNVENYHLPFKFDPNRKRKLARRRTSQSENGEEEPLVINDLETTETNSNEEIAFDIATKLSEPNTNLILRIVMIIGKAKAIEYFKETKEIEAKGGMLILNQSRRRTSGGIFIYLIRSDKSNSKSMINDIFYPPEVRKRTRTKKKRKEDRNAHGQSDGGQEDKEESGQEVLNNPPPSPVHQTDTVLPELPLRRQLVMYEDLNMDLV